MGMLEFGVVEMVQPEEWPPGEQIISMLKEMNIEISSVSQQSSPAYWQASIRTVLLKRYGWLDSLSSPLLSKRQSLYEKVGEKSRQLVLSNTEIEEIDNRWKEIVKQSKMAVDSNGSNSNASNSSSSTRNDLLEFLSTGGKSNQRELKWAVMRFQPGVQFKLHAHPNLEVIFCIQGEIHEIRMQGDPFVPSSMLQEELEQPSNSGNSGNTEENNNKTNPLVRGPNLTTLDRPWYFETLLEGQWLVNEVGSVHKSFTASAGEGCKLLVLWGGSHANIVPGEEPTLVNVLGALNAMDETLKKCECDKWETIQETFLPESERSTK